MTADGATAERLRDITLDKVQQVIGLNDAYKAHLTKTFGAHPEADQIAQDLQSGASSAGQALVRFIDGLTRAERAELVGLVWFGMGDHRPFSHAREYAHATADTGIPQYLAKKVLVLSTFLRGALEELGYRVG